MPPIFLERFLIFRKHFDRYLRYRSPIMAARLHVSPNRGASLNAANAQSIAAPTGLKMKRNREMKSFRILLFTLLLTAPILGAWAQDHTRSHEPGQVLALTHVHTAPGMFNAYINDLKANWRRSLEAQIEEGNVSSYGMYTVIAPREGEPNLILRVTYPNWATFDLSPDYYDELMKATFGSQDEAREAGVKRGELRTLGTEMLLQELKFKD